MTLLPQITLIAIMVSMACALPGVFLVLRGSTMVSDAITHTVLLGIVLAFFITGDLDSPLLIIGATLVGMLTVWLIESLYNTKLLGHDAAIGIVFPLFFSIAIILITRYAGDIHLDVDTVLMGELAFTPFNRVVLFGRDIGPAAFWRMFIIFLINGTFIGLFYKQLKVTTFDPDFASSIGISPIFFYYALMTLVSLTAVGAYEAVGSVLVVGFMVGPALAAFLLTNKLSMMILLSLVMSVINSFTGAYLAYYLDTTFAGTIAAVTGLTTLLIFLFSPKKGLLKNVFSKNRKQRQLNERAGTLQ